MGRPKGSKNKAPRSKARTAWETYNYWYDKYTKGNKAGWFSPKYDQAEFNRVYAMAKDAKLSNPARAVAQSQEYVNRKFEKQYRKYYDQELGDIRDKAARLNLFSDFVTDLIAQGYTMEEARNEFEEYFY